MADLGQIIRETQQEAAALPTDALRHEIEMNLYVQDAAIDQFSYFTRPGGGTVDDMIIATSTVMIAFITTAIYVRELTDRPAVHATVVVSPN